MRTLQQKTKVSINCVLVCVRVKHTKYIASMTRSSRARTESTPSSRCMRLYEIAYIQVHHGNNV